LDVNLNGTAAGASPSINYSNQDGAFIENQQQPHFLDPIPGEGENPTQPQNLYQYPLNGLRVLPEQQQQQQQPLQELQTQFHPPPYREPPALGNNSGPLPSFYDLPNSVPDYSTYQTHSSKFPVSPVIYKAL
ncbi:unnamed protein product, partial [Allacma fusca]